MAIFFRSAVATDAAAIAALHAKSWREHYKGIWAAAFLETDVVQNRLEVWHTRLTQPSNNQYIILAESNDQLVGFVCIYLHHDPTWGHLIDNLHVRTDWQGGGIGRLLLRQALDLTQKAMPTASTYLWVLKDNAPAIAFYDRMGGQNAETVFLDNPDGGQYWCCRYVWPMATAAI